MQIQYKVYRLDKVNRENTIDKLNHNKEIVYKFIDDDIVAIQYDYLKWTYKDLLEYMFDIENISQYIFTTSKFYNILNYFVKESISISDIKLVSLFEEENEKIYSYIQKINNNIEKENNLNKLLEDLQWYNYDEGIDINEMSFRIKAQNSSQRSKFHIYNNGVIAIDSDKIIEQVFMLMKKVI
ncbi:MAG: hypothetical protein KH020_11610 [Clostridiales bacterium]|nr:hypothetical protein [Clostridiales bacterium]